MAVQGRKISATKDYRLFGRSDDNRVTNLKKHRKLEKSMKQYGFLPCYPIVCYRTADGNLVVKDGQHRLAIAETLGQTVYWIEESIDFDVAIINCTAKVWVMRDYAEKYSRNGLKAYTDGLEFADAHHLPVGIAFAMLAGTTTFTNVQSVFEDGLFKIRDRQWAETVAGLYGPLVAISEDVKNARLLEACMAACRVKDFDSSRLLHNAARCRDKLVSLSTREAYLDMLEDIYNFGRKQLVGLKAQATMAMRERNATVAAAANKKNGKPKKEVVEAVA